MVGEHAWLQGACVVAGGHAWLLGGHAWLLGGAWLAGGHVWLPGGHAWFSRGQGVHGCREGGMHRAQQDMVKERVVRILLECILVFINFNFQEWDGKELKKCKWRSYM